MLRDKDRKPNYSVLSYKKYNRHAGCFPKSKPTPIFTTNTSKEDNSTHHSPPPKTSNLPNSPIPVPAVVPDPDRQQPRNHNDHQY